LWAARRRRGEEGHIFGQVLGFVGSALLGTAEGALWLFAEMAPYLLLGLGAAGVLHVALPVGAVAALLGGPGRGAVVRAALLGVPLPLCSCGVVPVAASLQKSGASRGAVVSFLVSTPTSGVDSILATYALMGPIFALIRPLVSGALGVLSGLGVRRLVPEVPDVPATASTPPQPAAAGGGCCDVPEGAACPDGLCAAPSAAQADDRQAAAPAPCGDGCCSSAPPAAATTPAWRRALSYAFDELLGDIGRPLLLGVLVGGALHWALPSDVLGQLGGWGWLAYPVLLVAGVPLYVCASGSIPVAAALLAKGVSPGAALVFLVVGPATNAASLSMLGGLLGRRAMAVYLVALTAGAVAAGLATDLLFAWLPADWVSSPVGTHSGELGVVHWGSAVVLGGLVAYREIANWRRRRRARGGAGQDILQQ